ncbi:MAG: hypothetical protein CL678_13335 [Bdellovibrionaceae bacterium]|nr:hypothetical protein [Pseudobdellovibrionaceae bacterium]
MLKLCSLLLLLFSSLSWAIPCEFLFDYSQAPLVETVISKMNDFSAEKDSPKIRVFERALRLFEATGSRKRLSHLPIPEWNFKLKNLLKKLEDVSKEITKWEQWAENNAPPYAKQILPDELKGARVLILFEKQKLEEIISKNNLTYEKLLKASLFYVSIGEWFESLKSFRKYVESPSTHSFFLPELSIYYIHQKIKDLSQTNNHRYDLFFPILFNPMFDEESTWDDLYESLPFFEEPILATLSTQVIDGTEQSPKKIWFHDKVHAQFRINSLMGQKYSARFLVSRSASGIYSLSFTLKRVYDFLLWFEQIEIERKKLNPEDQKKWKIGLIIHLRENASAFEDFEGRVPLHLNFTDPVQMITYLKLDEELPKKLVPEKKPKETKEAYQKRKIQKTIDWLFEENSAMIDAASRVKQKLNENNE